MQGNSEGQCIRCKRYFIGNRAFEKHQLLAPDTPDGVICMDPATRGFVIRERRNAQWWGYPEADDATRSMLKRRRPNQSAQQRQEDDDDARR